MKIRIYTKTNDKAYEIRNENTDELYAVAYDNYTAEFIRRVLEDKKNNDRQIEQLEKLLAEKCK